MRGRILLSASLLVLAAAVPRAAAGPVPGGAIRFQGLSLEEGLSQSTVYALLQDRRGFIWLGTQDGLNRYDGYGFLTYRQEPEEPLGLSSGYIRCLREGIDGALWIGTDRGLNRLEPASGAVTAFRHAEEDPRSLSHDFVYAIHEEADGTLWVGTENGLNRLHAKTGSFTRYRHDPRAGDTPGPHTILSLAGDRQGGLWVGSAAGLDRLDPQAAAAGGPLPGTAAAGVPAGAVVFALLQDSSGRLWIGTDDGLYRLASPAERPERVDLPPAPGSPGEGSQIRSLLEDRHGTLWIGTRDGVVALDPGGDEGRRFRPEPGEANALTSGYVRSILEDRSGLVWFGTDGGGASIYDPLRNAFRHHRSSASRASSLADDMILSVLEDRRGGLWVGTWRGGLNLSRDGGRTFTSYRSESTAGLDDDVVYAMAEAADGFLWFGTESGGLSRYDPRSGRFHAFRHDPDDPGTLSQDAILALLLDSQQQLWVGTWAAGINRCDPRTMRCEGFAHDPDDPRSLSDNTVYAIFEDAERNLWFGTESGGLNRRRPDAHGFDRFRHDPADPRSLSGDDVMAIQQDAAGAIWLGTYGQGLNRFDGPPGEFSHYTMRDGLPSNVVYGILKDDAGGLWLSTNGGLSRFDPASERVRNFDVGDGALSNEFNSGAFFRSTSGRLFFGSIAGLLSFDPPDLLAADGEPPPVVIASFRRLGRPTAPAAFVRGSPAIELDYEEPISFEFAVLDYRRPRRNRFAYKLAGPASEWIYLGIKRDITLTNLAPGSHSLLVKGANSRGIWNEAGVAVELIVAPPYWMTWKFRIAGALAILGLGLATHRLRLRAVAANNRRLQAINDRLQRQIVRRHEVEAALREKDLELELALAGSQTGTWSWRVAEDRIEGSTHAALILGLAPDQLSGTYERFLELTHPEEREMVEREMRRALETGGSYDLEHRIRRPDGSWRWIHGRGQASGDGARGSDKISGVVTDITRRKRAEQEREALIAELETRNAELEQFAYTVSHDLKSPLVTIRGFLGLAERDARSRSLDRLQRDLSQIDKAARTMTELIRGLLHLSAVGRVRNPHEPIDLKLLAEEAVAILEGPIQAGRVKIELDLAGTRVFGDRIRLREALQNLIENAVKFMGDQPAPRVSVGAFRQEGETFCFVRDNGIGIPAALQPKVFDLFTRLDPATEGSGLGLSLVKRIIEEHGGRVWVESEAARPGSTFWITLPSTT